MDDKTQDIDNRTQSECPTDGESGATAAQVEDIDEGEETETITMLDVLQEEQDLEDNAFAVLAGSDDKNCTYLKGYVSRQALYACNTCKLVATGAEEGPICAAICLACSYTCHDGHDLIELYTKRNFRCDCGNEKFAETECKLISKTTANALNRYNQNFNGLYCLCLRPYPDPDTDIDDSMIQCVVCEDWFHGRHLENFPKDEEFAEMICRNCMNGLPFLWFYSTTHSEIVTIKKCETSEHIDISSTDESKEQKPELMTATKESVRSEPSMACESDSGIENSCDSVDSSGKSSQCKLKGLKSTASKLKPEVLAPTYWPLEWRRSLCKCSECLNLYKQNKCLFLTDEKDMIHYYEKESIESKVKVSDYDKGLSELQKMDRTQQIEYISGYNDLQNSLKEYLRKFAESKKVVREEDIKQFFEQMTARKRQKFDIPYNCK